MAGLGGVGHVGVEGEPSAGCVGEGGAVKGEGQVGHGREVTGAELRRLALPAQQHTPIQVSTTTHAFRRFFVALRKEKTP